tara:strand:- start:283 stop:654 length:372 start_codon:yes stop_codon:yes gene_type:complete
MSLSLIFRLNAAFALLWAIQLIFMPNMMFAMYGWAPSTGLTAVAQAAGTAMTGIAILSFGLPNWTSESQLKTAAQSAGLIAILFTLLQLYQILISKAAPGAAMDWISTAITALFVIGFFMKSR